LFTIIREGKDGVIDMPSNWWC